MRLSEKIRVELPGIGQPYDYLVSVTADVERLEAERDALAEALRRAEGMIAIAQEEQMAAKARAWDRLQGLDLESSPDVKGLMADVLAEQAAGDADASQQGAK